jgi:hypothetical protein
MMVSSWANRLAPFRNPGLKRKREAGQSASHDGSGQGQSCRAGPVVMPTSIKVAQPLLIPHSSPQTTNLPHLHLYLISPGMEDHWSLHKEAIRCLFLDKEKSLKEVMEEMKRTYGFNYRYG